MATITDLQTLGYECGIAHGDVAVEQAALDAAQAAAVPATITQQVSDVTTQTIADMTADGTLPTDPADQLVLAQKIAAAVLAALTGRATAQVDFYTRSLAIAQAAATVWRVQQLGADGAAILSCLVAAKDDGTGWDDDAQAHIDSLADPGQYAERAYLHANPTALELIATAAARDVTITRPQPGQDVFELPDGTTKTLADLGPYVEALPVPPTTQEKVATALQQIQSQDATAPVTADQLAQVITALTG